MACTLEALRSEQDPLAHTKLSEPPETLIHRNVVSPLFSALLEGRDMRLARPLAQLRRSSNL